jgi:hypothetical protein
VSSVAFDQSHLLALLDAAERAGMQGQTAEAERLISAARSIAPDDPNVLNALGVRALRAGNFPEARTLLERAVSTAPHDPRLHLNLASTLREFKDRDGEMKALNDCLALDPYFALANFQKGSLLELLNRPGEAARAFNAGLASLRSGAAMPESLRPIIEHARATVRANFRDLEVWLEERMRDARARHEGDALDRVDDCVAAFVGKKRIYVQQPTGTHFPRLPAIQFFDRRDFPWIGAVEGATHEIRAELEALLASSLQDFGPYVAYDPGVPLNQWKELNHSRAWSALFLFQNGKPYDQNIARCPATMAALSAAPLLDIPGRSPTAFFSRLDPKTRIPPHTGVTNTRLTVHIPLIVPENCGFRVGSEVRRWQPGTALIFDDTIEHEAWNDSDAARVVLIFDIWNPLLTAAERDLISAATIGIGEFFEQA